MTLVLRMEGDVRESACPSGVLVRWTNRRMEIALLVHTVTCGDCCWRWEINHLRNTESQPREHERMDATFYENHILAQSSMMIAILFVNMYSLSFRYLSIMNATAMQ
jgi:hypothetical protein